MKEQSPFKKIFQIKLYLKIFKNEGLYFSQKLILLIPKWALTSTLKFYCIFGHLKDDVLLRWWVNVTPF